MIKLDLHTYRTYSREELNISNEEWDDLQRYVEFMGRIHKEWRSEDKIEESEPKIDEGAFDPGGWIGTYQLNGHVLRIVPNPETLKGKDFELIRSELTGWIEHIGFPMEEFMWKYSDQSISRRLLYAVYSRHLINYTEAICSNFVPRAIVEKIHIGQELRGRPMWKETMNLRAKNSPFQASRKIDFSLMTATNLLLTRFHANLLADMDYLYRKLRELNALDIFDNRSTKNLRNYRNYHRKFVTSYPWASLLEHSLDIDVECARLDKRCIGDSGSIIADLFDLWEAYVSDKSFFSRHGRFFDTSLKPLSKVYELWCFKKLCDILEVDMREIKKLPCTVPFEFAGKRCYLHYNDERMHEFSAIIRRITGGVGRPDFAVEFDGKIVCIMDAKCKRDLKLDDAQRLLSYVFDYLYPHGEELLSMVFIPSESEEMEVVEVKGFRLFLIPMLPSSFHEMKDEISSIFEKVLKK